MAPHPLLQRAAKHTAQARAINDEFEGKDMPAEAARQMKEHIEKASDCRARVERERALKESEKWLSEPEYKHDMVGDADTTGEGKPIDYSLESERKERQREAFFSYLRKGANGLTAEQKADLVEDANGQTLVPTDYAGTILKELPREATIRNLAFIRPTSSNKVDVGSVVIAAGGWGKLETGTVAADGLAADPANKDTITVHNLNALVKIGEDELEDTNDNVEEIIRSALTLKLAEQEDDAFAFGLGDASDQPWGITHNVTQGFASAAGETLVSDDVKKLKFAVPLQFRRNGVFLGHTSVEQAASLLKDGNGNYIWQERFREGEPPTLTGRPWYTVDGLPDMATTVDGAGAGTNPSLVYGDVRSGYMVADRRRLTVKRLAELYAAEGKIGLLFTHRVGGDVIRPKALARLLL